MLAFMGFDRFVQVTSDAVIINVPFLIGVILGVLLLIMGIRHRRWLFGKAWGVVKSPSTVMICIAGFGCGFWSMGRLSERQTLHAVQTDAADIANTFSNGLKNAEGMTNVTTTLAATDKWGSNYRLEVTIDNNGTTCLVTSPGGDRLFGTQDDIAMSASNQTLSPEVYRTLNSILPLRPELVEAPEPKAAKSADEKT